MPRFQTILTVLNAPIVYYRNPTARCASFDSLILSVFFFLPLTHSLAHTFARSRTGEQFIFAIFFWDYDFCYCFCWPVCSFDRSFLHFWFQLLALIYELSINSVRCAIIFVWFLMRSGEWVRQTASKILFMSFRYILCLRAPIRILTASAFLFHQLNSRWAFCAMSLDCRMPTSQSQWMCLFGFAYCVVCFAQYSLHNTRFISQFKINYFVFVAAHRLVQLNVWYSNRMVMCNAFAVDVHSRHFDVVSIL